MRPQNYALTDDRANLENLRMKEPYKSAAAGAHVPMQSEATVSKKPVDIKPRLVLTTKNKDSTSRLALPREFIQANSAFSTIINYCKKLTGGGSSNPSNGSVNTAENINDAKQSWSFFGKPVVDMPLSLP